jgi:AraC-like DNA-binding protein
MQRVRASQALSGSLPDVQSIGVSVWDPIYARYQHTGYNWEVVHIVSGRVNLHLRRTVYAGAAGDTLLVPARTPHRDEFPAGSAFEVLHLMFRWDDAARLFPRTINRDLLALPAVDKQAARELAFETYDVFRRQRPLCAEQTRACLYRLLLFLRSAALGLHAVPPDGAARAARRRHTEMIQEARDFIRANLGKAISLADIAAHLGISAYHLSHVFSEESGFTLSSFLANARMERAAGLLADPRGRISEAAYAVGFQDPNYFSKVFHRHFGCSPKQYQARLSRASRAANTGAA